MKNHEKTWKKLIISIFWKIGRFFQFLDSLTASKKKLYNYFNRQCSSKHFGTKYLKIWPKLSSGEFLESNIYSWLRISSFKFWKLLALNILFYKIPQTSILVRFSNIWYQIVWKIITYSKNTYKNQGIVNMPRTHEETWQYVIISIF